LVCEFETARKRSGEGWGVAYVDFDTSAHADAALASLRARRDWTAAGCPSHTPLRIDRNRRVSIEVPSSTLFVEAFDGPVQALAAAFAAYADCIVRVSKLRGRLGAVRFRSVEDATRALDDLNGKRVAHNDEELTLYYAPLQFRKWPSLQRRSANTQPSLGPPSEGASERVLD